MTEITFNQATDTSVAKVVVATKEETLNLGVVQKFLDRATFKKLLAVVSREEEDGEKKSLVTLDDGKNVVVLARLSNTATESELSNLAGAVYRHIKKYKNVSVYARHLPKTGFSAQDVANALAFGIELASYSFDKYQTTKKAHEYPKLETVNFVAKEKLDKKAYVNYAALANAVRYARDLTNEPSNELTPEIYAKDIKRLEHLGLKVTLLDEGDLKKKGFNMLLSVSQGSVNKPYVAILEYYGNKKNKGVDAALVGKGVTFDAGGISLKPAAGMWDMKQDMAGSAAVVATLKAVAQQKLNVNIVGIVGLVENLPSGTATRPGDVVTSLSGQTVEILNTDAEGRLVLGDCITYVEREFKPQYIVDIATLTGAIVVSLGSEMAGLFSNDDALAELLSISGEQAGENLWRFPLTNGYRKLIKSDVADIKNISEGRSAGSITAACFLEKFVMDKTSWAHLDIAGMDKVEKPKDLYPRGASGFGVRLLNQFVRNLEKK